MELSEEEKKAIEWLEKAEYFSARLYAPSILNLIDIINMTIDITLLKNILMKVECQVHIYMTKLKIKHHI